MEAPSVRENSSERWFHSFLHILFVSYEMRRDRRSKEKGEVNERKKGEMPLPAACLFSWIAFNNEPRESNGGTEGGGEEDGEEGEDTDIERVPKALARRGRDCVTENEKREGGYEFSVR